MTMAAAAGSLEMRSVSKRYRADGRSLIALDDVSLTVAPGEFMVIVGASGCGKSTLLRLLAGLDADHDGTILHDGAPVAGPSLQRGLVFQEPRLFPWLSVEANVLAALRNAGLTKAARRAAVRDHIALVGLQGFERAYRAPSTALAINMHVYWTGAAAYLWRRGDTSAQWILEEAVRGKIFAAGHGEPGNDVALAHSFVDAAPQPDGSYRFTGGKVFTSLSPVWDWIGVHGLNSSDPAHPKIVHAFIRRDAFGVRTVETWDTLGVRATRSDDTILDGAISAREHVTRVLPAGPPADPFIDGIFGWAIPGISIVYYGVAKRAFDLAAAGAQRRTSVALGGRTQAHHPLAQSSIAEAATRLDAIQALVERVAADWWNGVDHGAQWPAKILAAKVFAADTAREVVDLATKVGGASSLFRSNELERLYRDASHEIIGKTYLGVLDAPAAALLQAAPIAVAAE
jgi:alkylation response protein AidB-like acyl-CoA dehydrogenase